MRIKELTLFTKNLAQQAHFYNKTLGLPVLHQQADFLAFKIGSSILHFRQSADAKPYHFAINIPSNQTTEAYAWLKKRVEILKDGTNEIQNFDFWNAEALYFYDVDKNIVEFIARKNLKNHSDADFSALSLIELSEIGLSTSDIQREYNILQNTLDIEVFSGSFERFCAIGDEHGLIICIDKATKKWFPTNDIAYSSDFEMIVEQNDLHYHLKYADEVLQCIPKHKST